MMLTAARPGEALAARWDQIDWEKRIWSNPVSKTGKPLEVPLSSLALAILEQAKDRGVSDLIFANSRGGQLAHSHFASAATRAGIEAGTPHSWRSVFRDTAEDRLHFSRYVAEVALGHSLGAVEEAYRRDTGVERRREVMEAYAKWLGGPQANDNVADEKMGAAA
jgi:integrase